MRDPIGRSYGLDDTYGVKQNQAQQIYTSELPTPAPSDHNFASSSQVAPPNQLAQPSSLPSPIEHKVDIKKEDEYENDTTFWSEFDITELDSVIMPKCKPCYMSKLISVEPMPSSDIKDEEKPVTAEMIKQRNIDQEALERKRKEEISLKGAKAIEAKDGQIAVKDIESEPVQDYEDLEADGQMANTSLSGNSRISI